MALKIRLNDSPIDLRWEAIEVWNLEFTVGDVGPVEAFLTKNSLAGYPDPDLATATITFDLWGYVDGVDTHLLDGVACVLVDDATGLVSFDLPAGGLANEGDQFRGRFNVAYLDGRVESYPRGRQYINVLVRRP